MAKLKVFGGLIFNGSRQVRTIIAATSRAKAAAAVREPLYQFNGWFCETGNALEREMALANPGQVFQASDAVSRDFRPVLWVNGDWVDADAALARVL